MAWPNLTPSELNAITATYVETPTGPHNIVWGTVEDLRARAFGLCPISQEPSPTNIRWSDWTVTPLTDERGVIWGS